MSPALCIVPAAPIRREPAHRSEMTSQLLFGEPVVILETREEWRYIRSVLDGYEGWVTHHLLEPVAEEPAGSFVTTSLVSPLSWRGTRMQVPMGAVLPGFDAKKNVLWDGQSSYTGPYREEGRLDPGLILPLAMEWLNAPYLWGGKTLMGVDCSGLVQTVFRTAGIRLQRDAYQQALQGTRIERRSEAQPNDLAFFHNEQGRVIHVGILVSRDEIVHASGRVRIDTLSNEGIVNRETGRCTHELHSISRYV